MNITTLSPEVVLAPVSESSKKDPGIEEVRNKCYNAALIT